MKVGILAGGMGSRLSEMTDRIPKPMVEIGGKPILWHIMDHYSRFGFKEFIIALGYKGEVIKDYFINYHYRAQDLVVHLGEGKVERLGRPNEDWAVHLLDSGETTQTGGRIRRMLRYAKGQPIMATYGDGLSNVDLKALLQFHRRHGKAATVSAVRPPARFGGLQFEKNRVTRFVEKPQIGEGWINGGFFVLEPRVLDYIDDDQTIFEHEPMERLAAEGQLMAYQHGDFWQCMDTVRDLRHLEDLWQGGKAPWRVRRR
ncbi:MAG: glucose-1-phosphate cytidylyltransferase [Elusimicrobia bacterium]|nr:glucose-1-phosphate cytidylyltransferase [Elusimicrobiota bacterium]